MDERKFTEKELRRAISRCRRSYCDGKEDPHISIFEIFNHLGIEGTK